MAFSLCALLILLAVGSGSVVTADDSCSTLEVSEYKTDAPLYYMWWHGDSNKNILLLTTDGYVHSSDDEGVSFSKLGKDDVPGLDDDNPYGQFGVRYIYNTASSSRVLLLGWNNKIWTSEDNAKTFKHQAITDDDKEVVRSLIPHPSDPDKVLAGIQTAGCIDNKHGDCFLKLYYSTNFGSSWKKLDDYVHKADWGNTELNKDSIVYITYTKKEGNQVELNPRDRILYHTKNYGVVSNDHIPNTVDMKIVDGVIFVANYSNHDLLNLVVSLDDLHTHHRCEFPVDLKEMGYRILSTSEGLGMIAVTHLDEHDEWSYVYVSDETFSTFSLSIYPVKRNPKHGHLDFVFFNGLDGIAMANYYANVPDDDQSEEGTGEPLPEDGVRTVITYNKGASWRTIDPPEPISCQSNEECFLNLYGITQTWYGQPYTAESAIGLVFATGEIGPYLPETTSDENKVWLSRDAGWTWKAVKEGRFTFEFGHYGSVLVLIPQESSDSIWVSETQGTADWISCKVSDYEFEMENAVMEPSYKSRKFLLYGNDPDTDGNVFVTLDFSNLHERECEGEDHPDDSDSDFETWSPKDAPTGEQCLLGEKVVYIRRKADAKCYFSSEYEPQPSELHSCACTDEDYTCDFHYRQSVALDGVCILADPDFDPTEPPDPTCKEATYWVTQGYRKVPETKCTGGVKGKDPIEYDCKTRKPLHSDDVPTQSNSGTADESNNETGNGGDHLMLFIIAAASVAVVALLAAGVIIVVVKYNRNEEFREAVNDRLPSWVPFFKGRAASTTGAEEYFPLDVTYEDGLDDDVFGEDAPSIDAGDMSDF